MKITALELYDMMQKRDLTLVARGRVFGTVLPQKHAEDYGYRELATELNKYFGTEGQGIDTTKGDK